MRHLLATIVILASATGAHAEADHEAIARGALSEVIRSGYAALSQQADSLKDKIGPGGLAARQGSQFHWDNHAVLVR